MTVTDLILQRVTALLDDRRMAVWYDGERVFASLPGRLERPDRQVLDASRSVLAARREADARLAAMNSPNGAGRDAGSLLIYCPWARCQSPDARFEDPFELFAVVGGTFGDREAESLQSLARQAMPDQAESIDRLFRDGRPTLELLDGLQARAAYPILAQVLGTESAVEAAAQVLGRKGAIAEVAAAPGGPEEMLRLLREAFGYEQPPRKQTLESKLQPLGAYVLLSEMAFDLTGWGSGEPGTRPGLPESLRHLPIADHESKDRIFALCDRLRADERLRDAYLKMATELEKDLRLRDLQLGAGERDTLPCEERQHLSRLCRLVASGDLASARSVLDGRRTSIWSHLPERAQLWKLAERALDLFGALGAWERRRPAADRTIAEHAAAYTDSERGLWRVDRAQRLVEQSAADCAEHEEIEALVVTCRHEYKRAAWPFQDCFLAAVQRDGWPPEGVARQTQTFDRCVQPVLQEGRKIAYILVDALRYEMGRDLVAGLEPLGSVAVEPAATVLPAITPCGMAALMPGADGSFALAERATGLVPVVAGQQLPKSEDRMGLLRQQFGDRFADLSLEDLLSAPVKRLAGKYEKTDLLVVRTPDIDAIGEGLSLYQARRRISDLLPDLSRAVDRLAEMGFERIVLASDHGHVLLPEVAPGDAVTAPPGQWLLAKRRCRLGAGTAHAPGTVVLDAAKVGIVGPVTELAVPTGFRVFTAGEGYFHEGLSLQECLVPIVTVAVRNRRTPGAGKPSVEIRYKASRFTSRIIGLRVWFDSLLDETLPVRLEAFGGTAATAPRVGDAADCDARDPITGVIMLPRGMETPVPIRLDDAFKGDEVEIRAFDARGPGVVLHRLRLKSALMD